MEVLISEDTARERGSISLEMEMHDPEGDPNYYQILLRVQRKFRHHVTGEWLTSWYNAPLEINDLLVTNEISLRDNSILFRDVLFDGKAISLTVKTGFRQLHPGFRFCIGLLSLIAEQGIVDKLLQIVRSFLPVVIGVILSSEVLAQQQDTTTLILIETRDGNQYIGSIIERNNDEIRVQTEKLGIITIRLREVVTLEPVNRSQIKDNTVWFENPQATRYFWSPNGYGLKSGEGYYQNIWVLFNHFSVGVTDDFSIGGGLIPLFLFAGSPTPAWFTPKLSLPVKEDKLNLGVGGLFGGVLGLSETGFGIVYGTVTLGDRGQNLSIGMGYGYAGDNWANYPAISLSGMIRTGPRGYLLTENYYIGSDDASFVILSFGGRRIIKRTGLDFGLVIPSGDGEIIAVPWLGFTVPFGKGARL